MAMGLRHLAVVFVVAFCWHSWLSWLRVPLLFFAWALHINDALANLVWLLAEFGIFVQFDKPAPPGAGRRAAAAAAAGGADAAAAPRVCTTAHHGAMGGAALLGVALGRWLLGSWLVGGLTFGLLYGCMAGRLVAQRFLGGPAQPSLVIALSMWPFEIRIEGLVADETEDQAGVWGGMLDLGWAAPTHVSLRRLRLKLPLLHALRGSAIELEGFHATMQFHPNVRSVLEEARRGTGLGAGDTLRVLLDSKLSPNQAGMDVVIKEAQETLAKLKADCDLVPPKEPPWWKKLLLKMQGRGSQDEKKQQQQQKKEAQQRRGSALERHQKAQLKEKVVAAMEQVAQKEGSAGHPLAALRVLHAAMVVLERVPTRRTSSDMGQHASFHNDPTRINRHGTHLRTAFDHAIYAMRERVCKQLEERGVVYEVEGVRVYAADAECVWLETLLDVYTRAKEGKLTSEEDRETTLVGPEAQRGWLEFVVNRLINCLEHLTIRDTRVELRRATDTEPLAAWGADAKREIGFSVVAQVDCLALVPGEEAPSAPAGAPDAALVAELKEGIAVWQEAFGVQVGEQAPVSQQMYIDGLQICIGDEASLGTMAALLVPDAEAGNRTLTLKMEHGNLYGAAAPECNTPHTSCESNELRTEILVNPLSLRVSVDQLSQLNAFLDAMSQFDQWQYADSKLASDCCLNDTEPKHLIRYRDVFWTAQAQPFSVGLRLAVIGLAYMASRLAVPALVRRIPYLSWVLSNDSFVPLLSSLMQFWCGACACECGQGSAAAAPVCNVAVECTWGFLEHLTMPAFLLFAFGVVLHFALSPALRAAGIESPLQEWEDAVEELKAMERQMDGITILAHRYFARSAAEEFRSTALKQLPPLPFLSGDLTGSSPIPIFANDGQRLVADIVRFLELGCGQMLDYYDMDGREADYVWHNFASTAYPIIRAKIVVKLVEIELLCSTESTAMAVQYPDMDEESVYATGHSVAVVALEQLELTEVSLSMARTNYRDAVGLAATIRLQQIDVLESFHVWWFRAAVRYPWNAGDAEELRQLKQQVANHVVGCTGWHLDGVHAVTSSFVALLPRGAGECAVLGALVSNQLVPLEHVKKSLAEEFDAELSDVEVGTIYGADAQDEFLAHLRDFDPDVLRGQGACGDFRTCTNRTFASLLGNRRTAGHTYRRHHFHPHRTASSEAEGCGGHFAPAIALDVRLDEAYNYPRASFPASPFGPGLSVCPPAWSNLEVGPRAPDIKIEIVDLVCIAPHVLGLLSGFSCAMDGRYEGDSVLFVQPTAEEAAATWLVDPCTADLDPLTYLSFYLPREEVVQTTYPQEQYGTMLGLEFSKLSVELVVSAHVVVISDLLETIAEDWVRETVRMSSHSSFHGSERNTYTEQHLLREMVLSVQIDAKVSSAPRAMPFARPSFYHLATNFSPLFVDACRSRAAKWRNFWRRASPLCILPHARP